MTPETDLTAADRSILRLMQADARITLERLAEATALSVSAVQRRLQRLRDLKFILAEIAVIDPKKAGQPITLLVELELERDRPELLPALQRWIAETEAVQQAWYITGRGDLMLVIVAASIEHFDTLTGQMMDQNRNIRKFTTSVALKTLKRGLAIPVG